MDNLTKYHRNQLTPIALESLDRVLPGELSMTLGQLGMDFPQVLTQQFNEGLDIATLTKMLRTCPLSHRAIEILALRATPLLGDYTCSDDRTYYLSRLQSQITRQEWMRSNWQTMTGSLDRTIGMMLRQALFYGHAVAEIVGDSQVSGFPNQWRLSRLKILEPEQYYFAGRGGEVDRIIYYPRFMSPIPIPIQKLLVIYIPRADSPEDPYGDCAGARAYPMYLARQLALKAWTIAGQKQASGHLYFKTLSETAVQLLDRNGQPIRDSATGQIKTSSAVYATTQMAKGIANGDPIVVPKNVDVGTLNPGAGENFFNTFLTHLQKLILYCYGLPSTILDDTQSGIGNATISNGHMMILDSQIKGIIDIARQEILEKIVRPFSIVNFGADVARDLGEFTLSTSSDPATMGIMVSNIMQGFMQGIIPAGDFEATNRFKELCGLSPQTREEYDDEQRAKYQLEQQDVWYFSRPSGHINKI